MSSFQSWPALARALWRGGCLPGAGASSSSPPIGLVAALVAGIASGELAESWLFLLWDLTQSIAAGTLTMIALPHLLERARSR